MSYKYERNVGSTGAAAQYRDGTSFESLFLVIVVIGSIPGARQNVGQFASGLILHSTAYAILGALIFLGSRGSASRRALCTVITIAVMGAFDEYVQSF